MPNIDRANKWLDIVAEDLVVAEDLFKLLNLIKPMNIEARYQEYKFEVARTLNREKTAEMLDQTKQMHAWILEKLKVKSSTL